MILQLKEFIKNIIKQWVIFIRYNSFKKKNNTISLELAIQNCKLIIGAPTISPKSAYLLSQTYFILENMVGSLTNDTVIGAFNETSNYTGHNNNNNNNILEHQESQEVVEENKLPLVKKSEILETRIINSTNKKNTFEQYEDVSFKEYDDYFSQDFGEGKVYDAAVNFEESYCNNNNNNNNTTNTNMSNQSLMLRINDYAKKIMPKIRKKLSNGDYSSQTLDTFHFLSFITKEDISIVATIPWNYPENRYVSIDIKDVVNLEKYKNEILLEYSHGTKRNT